MTDPNEDEKPAPDEDFATLFAASEPKTKKKGKGTSEQRARTGDSVRGRVIAIGAETAFVEIGGKAEAVISLAEFRDAETGALTIAIIRRPALSTLSTLGWPASRPRSKFSPS